MTKRYSALTGFIPLLQDGNQGEWVVDKESKGTIDDPTQMPFVGYYRDASRFMDAVYEFVDANEDEGYRNYAAILEENGLEWGADSLRNADVSCLDGRCVVAMILSILRAERFCDGAYLDFLENGCIVKWLARLQEIDGEEDERATR